ncbi:class I SAM-dependent methyltransferase [uncultured Roseibium sp.]|uniref:class I SAM-dependent methyltransferase n=1 Tax=uncultured Roseibium sp. TaxID=1936171 RepID=UPI00261B3B0E|nr:class I SAM-dependent methyltransferase [uncultured Roseibium sp.]
MQFKSKTAEKKSGNTVSNFEQIRSAFRFLLDREIESEEVASAFSKLSKIELIRKITSSREFISKFGNLKTPTIAGSEPKLDIQLDLQPRELTALFDHIKSEWNRLGETDAHWSVASLEKFRAANMKQSTEEFYKVGESIINTTHKTLERCGLGLDSTTTALDFGCGLGRNTFPLANRYKTVLGYDISASHLKYAEKRRVENGKKNVSFHQLTLETIEAGLPAYDFLFSVIVFQHNPPPVTLYILSKLLEKLEEDGIAFFQILTYRKNYQFNAEGYLKEIKQGGGMEMHCVPQSALFELFHAHNCRVVEVTEDYWSGPTPGDLSNRFVLKKTRT